MGWEWFCQAFLKKGKIRYDFTITFKKRHGAKSFSASGTNTFSKATRYIVMAFLRVRVKTSLFLLIQVDHSADKTDQEGGANEDYQIGRKKGHDKPERVFQLIGGNQKIDPEKQKKTAQQRKNNLSYPPKNSC